MIDFKGVKMRNLAVSLFVTLVCLHVNAAETITIEAAVKLAEVFVAENGYTELPESGVKQALDHESIEWTYARKELLKQRRNTLLPAAIGAKYSRKNGQAGWSVAFDYTNQRGNPGSCRVVTMESNGREIRIEHVDGVREHFLGFKKR
ncbi:MULTISPECIES: hypothetical protein [unclassified Duganella]|uniref:hypothetical protein n=1 Tax=unclassified Duganella TaxID=2636909 RepID=UPI0011C1199C|nr:MULTISPECIES: hypothetical protein [unclassified Duganella]